jgi:predicted aspartyl protease
MATPKARAQAKERDDVGRFTVELDVANNDDLVLVRHGSLSPDKMRRLPIRGVVDTGSAELILPQGVAKQLGLRVKGKVRARYADRRSALRDEVEGVHVQLLGRADVFSAMVEPKRDTALIGAIVLEALDLLVDPKGQRLVPRDPEYKISEVE